MEAPSTRVSEMSSVAVTRLRPRSTSETVCWTQLCPRSRIRAATCSCSRSSVGTAGSSWPPRGSWTVYRRSQKRRRRTRRRFEASTSSAVSRNVPSGAVSRPTVASPSLGVPSRSPSTPQVARAVQDSPILHRLLLYSPRHTGSSRMEEVLVLARDQRPGVLKVMEVADELRIGRNQAYELVRSGQLRAVRIGQAIRVTREALEEFKAGREAAAGAR